MKSKEIIQLVKSAGGRITFKQVFTNLTVDNPFGDEFSDAVRRSVKAATGVDPGKINGNIANAVASKLG